MKTVTLTWRVSAEVKSALEKEARHEKVTVAALLDQVTRQWLQDRRAKSAGDLAGQSKLHAEAAKSIGKIAGENPFRSESVRVLIRQGLARKHDRRLSH